MTTAVLASPHARNQESPASSLSPRSRSILDRLCVGQLAMLGLMLGAVFLPGHAEGHLGRTAFETHTLLGDVGFILPLSILGLALVVASLWRARHFATELVGPATVPIGIAGFAGLMISSDWLHIFSDIQILVGEYVFGIAALAAVGLALAQFCCALVFRRRDRKRAA